MKYSPFAIYPLLLLFACSREPATTERNPGDPVSVFGTLGSGYTIANVASPGIKAISPRVTDIACIPIRSGSVDLSSIVEAPVAADGSFSLDIEPEAEVSYIFLMVNKDASELSQKAVGFLAMESESGSELVSIPLDFLKRDLDFGVANSDGRDAVSSIPMEEQQDLFNLTLDQLLAASYLDSLHKAAKNEYVNFDSPTNQWYRYAYAQYFSGPMSAGIGAFSSASSILANRSYCIGITALDPSGYTPDDVIAKSVNVEVAPPEVIAIPASTDTFSPTNPLSTTSLPSGFVVIKTDASALPGGFTGGYGISGSVLARLEGGQWSVRVDGEEKALFDLDPAVSFTSNDEFIFYVPSFKVESDDSGLVTAVSLKWLAWDPPSGVYKEVTDLSTFLRIGSGWNIGLHSNSAGEDEYFNKGDRVTSFEHEWYVSTPLPGGVPLTSLTTAYAIAGFSFGFNLNQ